jgi:putative nucleotidyltransferase with HDIG domain
MNERRVQRYVVLTCVLALVCIAVTDWASLASLPANSLLGLIGLLGIAVFSESLAIGLSLGEGGGGQFSITFLPLLASVQLFGVAGGIAMLLPAMAFAEFVVRRKPVIRATFNVAQTVVSATVAGWAWELAQGQPLHGVANPDIGRQLVPFVVFGLIFLAINHIAVSLAITLSQGLPFRRVLQQAISNSGANLNDILISPIALAVAFLYVQFGIAGILVVLLPMLFIRYSYLTTNKLRVSNSDLLTALVKAIEIRDPYTSGHSQRVCQLAQRIAEELGLNRITVQRVKDAALLHDIGKIEAAYTDILRKPDSLTPAERRMIESHVVRGEQLLRDLSSVHEDVVLAVRHHHEREDGNGYPDGLLGDEIPIGAKIIVACDAVDAMLSDRPYRRALPLTMVLEQLQEHAGRQFDHRVVRALMRSDILAAYADMMRAHREETFAEAGTSEQPASLIPPSAARVAVGAALAEPSRRYH